MNSNEHDQDQPSEDTVPKPPAPKPEMDLRSMLSHPVVRYGLATVGLVSLLLGIASGLASWNPWSLLVAAVVCVVLAFPRFVTENIKAIKLPGGSEVQLREPIAAATRPGAPRVEDLARRATEQRRPSSLGERRLLLAELRTAGVGVRNRGSQMDPANLTCWLAEADEWSDTTVAAVVEIDRADAEWFRTLDAVPAPRVQFHPINWEHAKAFRELDFKLVKLETLITRYAEWDRPENSSPPQDEM